MKRVMVFGTFDVLHPGHISFLKQAKKLGDYLIVSLARENNIRKIKGRAARHSEAERKSMLEAVKFVDKAVLGAREDYIGHILAQKPNVIALGYDQKAYTKELKSKLAKAGLKKIMIVRMKSFKPRQYKSSNFLK